MAETERSPLQREAIIDAARDLIVRDGLDSLSLRRLATSLGVTAPALYAHVTDKQDLLRAVAEIEFEHLVARFQTIDDPDPIERIRGHARAYADQARENPALFRVMFLFPPRLQAADDPLGYELPGATKAFAAATEAITDAIDAGLLVSEDPLLTAFAMWSASHGAATVLQLGFELGTEFEDRMVAEVTDRMIDGYRPRAT